MIEKAKCSLSMTYSTCLLCVANKDLQSWRAPTMFEASAEILWSCFLMGCSTSHFFDKMYMHEVHTGSY